jgi:hypothetical protein
MFDSCDLCGSRIRFITDILRRYNTVASNNSSSGSSAAGGGCSILTVLQIIFIVLKVAGVGNFANWPWWKVLIPTWIGLGLFLLVVLIVIIVLVIKSIRFRR